VIVIPIPPTPDDEWSRVDVAIIGGVVEVYTYPEVSSE
jgi:hypothetical protein